MATIEFGDFDAYQKALESIYKDTEGIVKQAVYKGAGIVADAIRQNLESLPIQEGENGLPPIATPENPLTGVSRRQKVDLINAFGLAPIEKDGDYIQTKPGVDGYGSVKTKKYPNGVPNAMLLRSIESGTSFRKKHPVFRSAVTKARKRAESAMQKEIDDALQRKFE